MSESRPGAVSHERTIRRGAGEAGSEQSRPHVALVGLPGSGKSAVAPLVAERLGLPAVDLDDEIAARAGLPVPDLVARDEGGFRALEVAVLAEILERGVRSVVALGGGAVLAPSSRVALRRRATVAWLACEPALLAGRLSAAGATARPLLAGDLAASLLRLAAAREAVYEEVADLVVDAAAPPEVVADAVVAALMARGWCEPIVGTAPSAAAGAVRR